MTQYAKDLQYYKFSAYGFLKNLRFFDAFLILILVEQGLSYTEIGILYAAREIISNILEIPSGIVADTFGRKSALIGAFLIYITSFILFYYSASFWPFMVAFLLYGSADAFRSGTHKGMIMEYLRLNQWESHKVDYYGHTRSWSLNGSAVASLIAGITIYFTGMYRSVFLFSIIPYLIDFALIASYPKALNYAHENVAPTRRFDLFATLTSFFRVIRQGNVLNVISSSALPSAYLKATKDYLQPLMVHIALLVPFMLEQDVQKKNGIVIGILYFFIFLATSQASKRAANFTSEKWDVPRITMFLSLGLGIICGILFTFEYWVISLIAFVGVFIIENLRKPILTGMVADRVPNEILTSVLSAQSLFKTLMTAIIALGFGLLADHAGIGGAFVWVSLVLLVLSLLIRTSSVVSK